MRRYSSWHGRERLVRKYWKAKPGVDAIFGKYISMARAVSRGSARKFRRYERTRACNYNFTCLSRELRIITYSRTTLSLGILDVNPVHGEPHGTGGEDGCGRALSV